MRSLKRNKKSTETTTGLGRKLIAVIVAIIGISLATIGWFVPDLINNIWPELVQKIPHNIWNLIYFPVAVICALLFSVSWLFFVLFLKKLIEKML
jgi:hypothetical protein